MKVTTDACLFGAFVSQEIRSRDPIAIGSGVQNILDIGTGTGLLSLMVAQQCNAAIDAIEIDKDAFEQASANVAASPWPNQLKVFHGDVKGFEFNKKYDVIVSNPPFYENELKGDNAKKNLAHHDEGLLLPELLAIIKKNLNPGGTFYLLLPYKRNEETRKLFTESDFVIEQLTFIKQSVNHDYFRIILNGKLKSDNQVETKIDDISIKDDPKDRSAQQYTPAFINLLRSYYLHL